MGFLAKATSIQITPDLFAELRQDHNFNEILRDLDVDEEDQFNLFETLDLDGNGFLDLNELFEGITKLRGDARRSDVITIQLMIRALHMELREFSKQVLHVLDAAVEGSHSQNQIPKPARTSSQSWTKSSLASVTEM